jgi:CRISPR/Cas system CMR-associated protein Cmr3 (group 5 of RAMP superfamily)
MWLTELQSSLTNTIEKWKFLDNKQIFEKDDEVGVVFDEINTTINELEQRME